LVWQDRAQTTKILPNKDPYQSKKNSNPGRRKKWGEMLGRRASQHSFAAKVFMGIRSSRMSRALQDK
jgi:hypothetical protein